MNALRNAIQRNTVAATRRFASSAAVPNKALPEMYQTYSFKKAFLEDPSTYPIIAIMGFITFFLVGMSANAVMNYEDVRIVGDKRHHEVRDWMKEPRTILCKKFAQWPIIMHGKEYRSTLQEGLGVDHEEWLKAKEQSK